MNTFGKNFRITTFGESHGIALGAIIDGCPAGLELNINDIQKELDKRRPGVNKISSQRKELDKAEILSGIFEGKTLGTPIAVIVRNEDNRSRDYENIKKLYRPGHSDEAWDLKYGVRDYRGGGRSSGRETIGRVIGGSVAKKFISESGVEIFAHVISIGDISVEKFDKNEIEKNDIRCGDKDIAKQMEDLIIKTKQEGNSLGGIVKLHIVNCPIGLGEPVFDKFQALIAHSIFSIGTVRSIELVPGKSMSKIKGSESNRINSGVSGGITNGGEIIFEIGIKPTPSIGIPQDMKIKKGGIFENLKYKAESLFRGKDLDFGLQKDVIITGRHDPCIAPRAVPVIESMCALVIADLILERRMNLV